MGNLPVDLAFDGTNLWVTNENDDAVVKLLTDGTIEHTYGVQDNPVGILFDGTSIWAVNGTTSTVSKISHGH